MALSPEAKARLDYYRKSGALPDDVLPYFYQRLQYAPAGLTDEQIIDHAVHNTSRDRMSRLVGGTANVLEAPEVPFQQFQRQIDEQGLAKVALGIGESIVTSPFRAVGTAKKALTGGHIEDYADAADAALMFLPGIGLGKSALSRLTRGAIKPRGNVLRPASQIGEAASPFIAGDQEFIQELIASGTMEGAAQLLDYRKRQSAPSEATGGAGVVPPPALSAPTDPRQNWQGATVGDPYTRSAYNQGATVGDPYSQPRAGLSQPPPAGLTGDVPGATVGSPYTRGEYNQGVTVGSPYTRQQGGLPPASQIPITGTQVGNLGQFGAQQSTRPTRGGQGQPTQSFGTTLYSDPFSAAFQLLPSLFARAGRESTTSSSRLSDLRNAIGQINDNNEGLSTDYVPSAFSEDTRMESLISNIDSMIDGNDIGASMDLTMQYIIHSDEQLSRFIEEVRTRGAYEALNTAEARREADGSFTAQAERDRINSIVRGDSMQRQAERAVGRRPAETPAGIEIPQGRGESGVAAAPTGPDQPSAFGTPQTETDVDTSDIDDLLREIEELTDDSDGGTTLYSDPFSATFDWAGKYLERHLKGAWRGRPTVKRQPGQPAQPTPTPNQQFSSGRPTIYPRLYPRQHAALDTTETRTATFYLPGWLHEHGADR